MIFRSIASFFAMIATPFLVVLDWLTPIAALAARGWIGYVFLKSGILKLQDWDATITLFTDQFQVPLLTPKYAALIGTAAEVALPCFVILGFGSRLMAALLFIFNLIAVLSYPSLWNNGISTGLEQHINWGVILGLLMCFGYSKLSLDYLITRGSQR